MIADCLIISEIGKNWMKRWTQNELQWLQESRIQIAPKLTNVWLSLTNVDVIQTAQNQTSRGDRCLVVRTGSNTLLLSYISKKIFISKNNFLW